MCVFVNSRRSGVVAICLLEDCENRGSTVNTYSSRISILVDNNNFSIAVILAICLPVDCGLETAAKLRGPWLNSTDRIETCNTLRACWENFQTIISNHVFSHIWYLMALNVSWSERIGLCELFSQSRSSSNLLLIIQIFPQSINQGVLVEIIVRSEIDFCLVKIVLNSC